MRIEIERKFLVCGEGWRRQVLAAELLRQGYLAVDAKKVIRIRVSEKRGILTIKEASGEISRGEFEYDIPHDEACRMVATMSVGFIVEKIRHRLCYRGKLWEVDEFFQENSGLVVAEVELEKVEEFFERPPWLGREVSGEQRFSNAALSLKPFCQWPDRSALTA